MGEDSSNVGNPQIYNQRNIGYKEERRQKSEHRYDRGTKNSHKATESSTHRPKMYVAPHLQKEFPTCQGEAN